MRLSAWIVDCLDRDSLQNLKASLKKAINIVCLSSTPVEDLRLCLCYVRLTTNTNIELKFVISLTKVSLTIFHKAIDQLESSEGRNDQLKLAAVLKKVMDRFESEKRQLPNDQYETAYKEIHIVSKSLEFGPGLAKIMRIACRKNIQLCFHGFIDDVDKGGELDDGGRSVELMHAKFGQEVEQIENVSFFNCVASEIMIDKMVMTWVRDMLQSSSVSITLIFNSGQCSYRLQCTAFNPYLKLRSALEHPLHCPCHLKPIDPEKCRCAIGNAILRKRECVEDSSKFTFEENGVQIAVDQLGSSQEGSVMTVTRRIPIDILNAHRVGTGVQICFDAMESDEENINQAQLLMTICKVTAEKKQALIAEGQIDLETGNISLFPINYVLIPSEVTNLYSIGGHVDSRTEEQFTLSDFG